ncbi:inositol hexakisphosphate and diphosphoinositol-pentakisphosphate kinase [Dimargaris cristalligena]|nr:inositol hexakisphosphate and diphosphoinositol-pentakisphosphate kinase [Dimargaris cristalligena]
MTKPGEVFSTSPHFFEFPKNNDKKFVIGVCAMDKKARSKHMGNIIERLMQYGIFEIIVFGDKVILDEDIEQWPYCDYMISFFSKGFPLRKAIAYQKLRGVFSVNNLPLQELLWDRRLVMEVLGRIGVHTPPRWTVSRDGGPFVSDDVAAILKNRMGVRLKRTEKPPVVHHIDEDTISINGEIIRKPFVEKPVSGEDHNIYIYFSTEQGGGVRKLFRKVGNKSSEYFPDLWEIRKEGSFIYEDFMDVDNAEDVKVYTIGTNYIHAETRKSPVVDGIVKRNADGKEVRYETELTPEEKRFARKVSMSFGQAVCGIDFLRVDGTSYVIDVNGWSFVKGCSEYYEVCSQYLHDIFLQAAERRWFSMYLWKKPSYDDQWTLKGFLSVFRHADRTPKQKIKYGFTSEPFVALLKGTHQEVILRKETDLAQVLKAAETAQEANLEDEDKLEQLQSILSRKMGMEGTKVQLKPSYSKVTGALVKLQVILKWGGGCTHAGIHHTRELADNMRKDLIILNKRILDDVVVYSSSEQRVIATAKVFCERLLNCTHLPSDFLIIRKDMLDDSNAAKEEMDHVKSRLKAFFKAHEANLEVSKGFDLPDEMEDPQTFVRGVYDLLTRVTRNMRKNLESPQVQNAILKNYYWCCNENVALFRERWEKLLQDFGKVEKNKFDPGKVGELYDSLKYDALHNRKLMDRIFVSPDGSGNSSSSSHQRNPSGGNSANLGESLGLTPANTHHPSSRRISDVFNSLSLSQATQPPFNDSFQSPSGRTTSLPATSLFTTPPSSEGSVGGGGSAPQLPRPIPLNPARPTAYRMTPGTSGGSSVEDSTSNTVAPVLTSGGGPPSSQSRGGGGGGDTAGVSPLDKSPPTPTAASYPSSSLSRRGSLSSRGRISPFPYNRTSLARAGGNSTSGHTPESIRELYHKAKLLFDFVTPREYGIDESEKLEIGVLTSVPLLKQIISDLRQMTQQDYPGCRLYFTKESHIHTLLNCVFLSGLPTNFSVYQAGELDFLTQITFEVYERKRDHQGLEPEYSLRLGFSPGAYYSNVIDHQVDSNHALAAAARRDLTDHIELNKALGYFQTMLDDTEKRDRGSGPRLTNRLDPDVAKS